MNERSESLDSPKRRSGSLRASTIVIVLLVPIAVQTGLILLAKRFTSSVPWYGNFYSQIISAFVGFALLVHRFRWRALPWFMVYVPLMFGVLVYYSLVFVAAAYGDSL